MTGLESAQKAVFNFRQLRDGLDKAINELESEKQTDLLVRRLYLVARFTRATCDAFISMAGTLGALLLPGKAGESADKMASGYAAGMPTIDALATSAAGGKGDYFKAATTAVKEGAKFVTKGNEGAELATKSGVVKIEVLKGAMNHDGEGIIKAGADYIVDLNAYAFEQAGHKGKIAGAFVKLAKSAFEYNDAIGKAFDDFLEDDLQSRERVHALKTNLVHQSKLLSKKIAELDQFLSDCSAELTDQE